MIPEPIPRKGHKSLENRYVYKHPVMHFRDDGKQQYSLGKTHMSRNCKMTIPNPYKTLCSLFILK